MNLDLLFLIFNNAVLPAWLLLIFLPRWWLTQWLMRVPIFPLIYASIYLVLTLAGLFGTGEANPNGSFFSLDGVSALFSQKEVVLVGWVHYLAFDLWVGTWELRDSQKRGIAHYFVIPCLVTTLMLGPIGFLMYWLLRTWQSKSAVEQVGNHS